MPLNIPNTQLPFSGLNQAIATGGNLFSQMMNPVIERENMMRQWKQHLENMALQKQQMAHAARNDDLKRQILKERYTGLRHDNDPTWDAQQLQSKLDSIQNLGGKSGAKSNTQEEVPQGQGPLMPKDRAIENKLPGGLDMDEIKRALTYQALGLKPPATGVYKEPPHIKRANDLKSKMQEAEYKHNLKLAEEQQKNEFKNAQTRQKVVDSAKNDLPHLEETLRSLKIMQKIAEDPKNDDMFGHWIQGHGTAASRATNPNAGTWQVYGLDPIVAAEMKMSARGNQLALKSALQNKANFAETRPVAAAKLKGSIDKIEHQIKEMRRISGEGVESDKVIVIDPNGKRFETTKENAAHLPEGWRHG